ncbi:MAG: fumarylacetoacetate hydrolase family protein [Acidobacteria bacterium]|nr:fumarylacetoacetate hydrolase family protein [Acidobacteriota bacterium]
MRSQLILGVVIASTIAGVLTHAQAPTPFKLGTFEREGRTFVGIVLRESVVIDFPTAHAAIRTPASTVAPPTDMKDLINRYDTGLRARIVEIVRSVENAGASRPPYVHEVRAVKILPPIMYPTTMLNVAVNYSEHDLEMAKLREQVPGMGAATSGSALPNTRSAPGIWERAADDTRWNPYVFMKSPAAIIAEGEAIRLPPGRTNVDWECEMSAVVSKPASRVPVSQAANFIFGYTLQNDVSDRGGRGDTRYGSDWVVSKNHDTFAPLGPFITPREFVPDPQKLAVTFSLNGQVLQQANTSFMIHNVFEQMAYATSIMTLRTGDLVTTGTPAGVGSARTPPIYFKAGDRSVCTYEGIGTLTNTVVGPTP